MLHIPFLLWVLIPRVNVLKNAGVARFSVQIMRGRHRFSDQVVRIVDLITVLMCYWV
ncbi:unnamed protein product [Acanthoscelides obtectus]|uniref:Uncharacterized protein n=1 Tax=Acanthoscelides obtectus TaxID=200917 RepID=A0A9P0LU41_ACAOB|nr:unnamed protein product [Acanthoscelides obtectus]CAK1649687.1 hypothetical protein AOBTE_LOCUS16357 [Acanthoscelides obtectus]